MTSPYDDGYEPTVPTLLFAVLLGATLLMAIVFAYAGESDRATDRQSPPGLWESTPVSTEVTGG